MKIHQQTTTVKTGSRIAVENVTYFVRSEVAASGIDVGLVVVSVPHTTCGLVVNEDEAGLREDIRRLADRLLAPLRDEAAFQHDAIDDNAQAHLTSLLLGHEATLPVSGGEPVLGTWQSVFLVETDGPRSREVRVTVLGE